MTYEQCLALTGDKWAELEDSQKISVLQTIENHIAAESGRQACSVVGRWLYTGEDGIVLGSYSRETKSIYVNTSQFDPESKYGRDPDRIITTCIHEGRHAYQDQVVKGYVEHDNFEEAEIWKENLSEENYISYREDPIAYYTQPVEVDARTYAEKRMSIFQEERATYMQNDAALSTAKTTFEQQIHNTCNSESQAACYISESRSNNMSTAL